MKIVHFETSDADSALYSISNFETHHTSDTLHAETTMHAIDAEVVSVFIHSRVDKKTIDKLPNLKLIVTRSTGYDHIDVAYATAKGITVSNVPSYGSRTVAEFTFALLLSLSRKINIASDLIKQKNNWDATQFEGFNLQGKTIGIIGTGKIGLNVAQIAKGFGMHIIGHDAFPSEQKALDYGFTYVPLQELLAQSDIITLHVPASPDTHHLINLETIKLCKPGSILLNTSRGDVVDPEALLFGLHNNILKGAGLDVLEGELELKEESELMMRNNLNLEQMKLLTENHILLQHPHVIITPHIAFDTVEARAEIVQTTISNIEKYFLQQPQNIVQ